MQISEFLERAAPAPTQPLDVEHVLAMARRPRWYTRRWLWFPGLVALAGAAIPTGIALAPASSTGGTRVQSIRPRPDPGGSMREPNDGGSASLSAAANSSAGAPSVGSAARSAGALGPAPGVTVASAPSQPTRAPTTIGAGYPRAAACSLDSIGLAPGQTRRCQFTATAPGGWLWDNSRGDAGIASAPEATVTVTHAGTTKTYRSEFQVDCADAIISPGDQVQLSLTAPVTDVTITYRTGAGRGWGCSTPTESGAPA